MIRRALHLGVSDDLDAVVAALLDAPRGASDAPGGASDAPGGASDAPRILAVSTHGAGEAAFALAAAGASAVIALDLEAPAELAAIVELKRTAWALFGREDALVILGLRPASRLRRHALTRQLLAALPAPAQAYWRARRAWLEGGLFHEDAVSLAVRTLLRGLRALASPGDYRAMLHDPAPQVRRETFARLVDQRWLDRLLTLLGGRINVFFPDAEWRASEYPRALTRDPRHYLEGLLEAGLATSPLFAHVVHGPDTVLAPELLPPHLRAGAYDQLRARAERVHVPSGVARLHLPLADRSADAAYLSNAIDYLDAGDRALFFRELRRVLRDGAPLLVASNEAYPKVPLELGFALDEARSAHLASADRARIYRRFEVYRAQTVTAARRLRVVECA